MGRPKIAKKEKHVSLGVTVSPEALAKTKHIAKATGKSRSFVVNKIIIDHKP